MMRHSSVFGKFHALLHSLARNLSGYFRPAPAFFSLVLLLAAIAVVSLVLALPLWYVSTNFSGIYTGIVSALIIITCSIIIYKKISTGRFVLNFVRFAGLSAELVLISILFYKKTLFYIPAILLSIEFLVFLGFSSRIDGFLPNGMITVFTISSFIVYLYSVLIMFSAREYLLAIPISIIYLFAFGRLIVKKAKNPVDDGYASSNP